MRFKQNKNIYLRYGALLNQVGGIVPRYKSVNHCLIIPPVCRIITAVHRELPTRGLKHEYWMQPFALSGVLFTKPASKGADEEKTIINNRLIIT